MSSNVPPAGPRKRRDLDTVTTAALAGAELLDDVDLAQALHNALDRVIIRSGGDRGDELGQDLRELAAVCLTTARRLEARR